MITNLALLVGGAELLIAIFVPNAIVASARRKIAQGNWPASADTGPPLPGDLGKLCTVFQTRLIIVAALLEGAAFFFIISYLIEGHPVSLIAAGLFLIGIASRVPTRASVERWLEEQQGLLQQERAGG